jgi:hypothetical protein
MSTKNAEEHIELARKRTNYIVPGPEYGIALGTLHALIAIAQLLKSIEVKLATADQEIETRK